jgi:putative DNA methylase
VPEAGGYRKKLIEVALPLPEINDASAFDKRPGIGPHPKGLHHWWARLPLPTSRAVLFASVVDDPSEHPERWPTEAAQSVERERLFGIIRRMMGKKLHEHPEVYAEACAEMLRHCDDRLPAVYDPFAGGGSIPLEANRLGFEAHAGDLNPVAVLLNKCNLELAPRCAGRPPMNPEDRKRIGGTQSWRGTAGLAADVRYYGQRILVRAVEKIGHLYPKVRLPKEYGGGEANVIAWIWARTVASPNPAARGAHVPLMSTFWLSSKKGGEAWLEPIVDRTQGTWRFEVRKDTPADRAMVKAGTRTGRAQFRCVLTGAPIDDQHIKEEGRAGRIGERLVAIVAEGARGRVYLSATEEHEAIARQAEPAWKPEERVEYDPIAIKTPLWGLSTVAQHFTARQLAAMATLSDLVKGIGNEVRRDAAAAGLPPQEADAYARTVTTFLGLGVDRCADSNNSLCRWDQSPAGQRVKNLFGRQVIPMLWDFAEANIFGERSVCWSSAVEITADAIESLTSTAGGRATARQVDAASGGDSLGNLLVSTDPPYYDNIGYAALSDFFYVWLRRTVGELYPELFSTVLAPKTQELTASPERFDGDKEKAKEHFERGFRNAFTALREKMDPRFPLTVYYAFKQADEERDSDEEDEVEGNSRVDRTTGWETLLDSLISSGFQITATWPVRASQAWRMLAMGANALASYIVLACRPRSSDAPPSDRRSFVAELKRDLPAALRHLQQGNIAPVDFAQAAIGPGMAAYSRYSRILDSRGNPMSVRAALSLINQTLTEVLSEHEDEFDADTRWAIAWFEEHGFAEGDFGKAEVLSKAKVTSVAGLEHADIVVSKSGRVRLLRPDELSKDWDPSTDKRLTVWEITHHLVRVYFHEKAGDEATAALLRKVGSRGGVARDLAYRLFDVCEKKKRSQEAQAYNALVLGWPEVARLALQGPTTEQAPLFRRN